MKKLSLFFLLLAALQARAQNGDGQEVRGDWYDQKRINLETLAVQKADQLVDELERIQGAARYTVDSTTALTVVKPQALELYQELQKKAHGAVAYRNFWDKFSSKLEDWDSPSYDYTRKEEGLSGLEIGSALGGIAAGLLWGADTDASVLGYILKAGVGLVGGPALKSGGKALVSRLGSRLTEKRISGIFFDRLKERGLPVPRVRRERWLKKYLEGFVPDVMLLESPKALEGEILRFKQVLLDQADALADQPARQEILLGLADALPPVSGAKRRLRPKKWVKDSFAKLNVIKDSYVEIVKEMNLELGPAKAKELAFQPIEVVKTKFLPPVKSNSLWIYFHPNTDFSRWLLQEYGAHFIPLELLDLAETSEVSKIALWAELRQIVEPKAGVKKALYRLSLRFWFAADVDVKVDFEFSSDKESQIAIIQEGKWIENAESKVREALEASTAFRDLRERVNRLRLCENNASGRLMLESGDEP